MARKFLDPSSIFQIEVGMHVLLSIFSPEIVLHQFRKTRYVSTYFQLNPIFENLATLVHFTLFLASLWLLNQVLSFTILCHDGTPIRILLHTMNPKVEEALDMVKIAIRNMKEFKTCFQEYKIKLPSYFINKPQKSWEFQVGSIIACRSTNYKLMTPIVTKLWREMEK